MEGPLAARTPDGSRWHFQHGPIDLILEAFGQPDQVDESYRRAWSRFQGVLDELVTELPRLRSPLDGSGFRGSVARRMEAAVARFPGTFMTPMAAVAGAVADEICAEMTSCELCRAYVNDGGDIALHLSPGETFAVGVVPVPQRPELLGKATIRADDPVRGIATSGRHGRSFSLGIADAVTVLGADAATADAAATLIGNAIDLPGHPAIERTPASELDPSSDLGERLVTVAVGDLAQDEIDAALTAGADVAEEMRASGRIVAAILCLAGGVRTVGHPRGVPSAVARGEGPKLRSAPVPARGGERRTSGRS